MLWVGAGPGAGRATLLVLLAGWAWAQCCRQCGVVSAHPPGHPNPLLPWNSQQRLGPRQWLTGWPAMLQRRENSDSVAQLQFGWLGGWQAAMSTWQLCTSGSLGTSHSRDTRASSWVQVLA